MKDRIEANEHFNLKEFNLDLLKRSFPQFFLKNGSFDMKRFEEEISTTTNVEKEGYSLNWLGKSYAKVIANLDTETMITPDLNHNEQLENKDSENLYIKGDNLDVLKHLVNAYSNEIKIIYIDPPYNTGSDEFVYNDDFNFTPQQLSDLADIDPEESKRILDFTDRNSNSHSAWLTFMYPRLFVARELLSEDGIIMISIDDNEFAQLKFLCNEIYGEDNFVGTITWEKRTKAQNTLDAREMLQSKTEYILLYKKTQNAIRFNLEVKYTKDYPESDKKGVFRYQRVEQMSSLGMRGRETMIFPILGINPEESKQWKHGQDTINTFSKRDDLILIDNKPYFKIRPSDEDAQGYFPFWSHFFDKDSYGTAETGKKELTNILNTNKHDFETVKPLALIRKLLFHNKTSENEIILDFFSGSGTTAHAIMQLNAEDEKKRRYIMVQIPEPIKEGSSAKEYGYKDITEIGIERIKKAAEKIKEEKSAKIDYGFKVYRTVPIAKPTLDKMIDFKGEFISTDEILSDMNLDTVLSTWLLRDGHQLTTKCELVDLNNYEAYKVGSTLYLLNKSFSIEENFKRIVENLEKDKDFVITKIVVMGYSFDTQTLLSLQENVKHLINGRKSADVHLEVRY